MFHSSHSPNKKNLFFFFALILTLCLVTTPIFAADPEEADPDPELQASAGSGSVTRVLVLSDLSELDPTRLAPGRYVVRIVDAEGTRAVYEIVVRR